MLTVIAEKNKIKNGEILIDDKGECNHIQNVFRLNVGDALRVIDGEYEYSTEIVAMAKNKVLLRIKERLEDRYTPEREIHVALGVLKNDKMSLAIQKLTEIGVRKIIPMESTRTVVKLSGKKEKWDTTVREAMKQCKAVQFTLVDALKKLKKIDYAEYDKIVFAYENSESAQKISDIITEKDKKILYVIGPEGGITKEEVEFLAGKGGVEISLGKRILRAETAAIVLGGILVNL